MNCSVIQNVLGRRFTQLQKLLSLSVMKNICANEQDDAIYVLQNATLSNRFGTQCFLVKYTVKVDELLIITLLCYVF